MIIFRIRYTFGNRLRGWFPILHEPLKIDVITRDDKWVIHKQIEKKNGLTFMRMKKRLIKNPLAF